VRDGDDYLLAEIITARFFGHVSYQSALCSISPLLDMQGTKERLCDKNAKTT
jgi:hypothetical protein